MICLPLVQVSKDVGWHAAGASHLHSLCKIVQNCFSEKWEWDGQVGYKESSYAV